MQEQEFLDYLKEVGLTPANWFDYRENIQLNTPTLSSNSLKEIEKLKTKFSTNDDIIQIIKELDTKIGEVNKSKFTVQELYVTDTNGDNSGCGEEVAVLLYIPKFNYVIKATGEYYSYDGVINFTEWQIVTKNTKSVVVDYYGL